MLTWGLGAELKNSYGLKKSRRTAKDAVGSCEHPGATEEGAATSQGAEDRRLDTHRNRTRLS